MPDLDVIAMRVCQSSDHWRAEVQGSGSEVYRVTFGPTYDNRSSYTHGWSCSCPAFRHRHFECKHIRLVKKYRCGWHEQFGGKGPAAEPLPAGVRILTPPSYDPKEDTLEPCPCCGGATFAVRCAV